MAIRITGITALVTGANRGIGRALVEALLARGAAKVYATARRPEALADSRRPLRDRVVPLRLDVTRPSEVRAVAAQADDVRLLINNAGIVAKFGGELTDAEWIAAGREEFEVNVLGVLSLTQTFAPALLRRPGAAVVNIGSVAGSRRLPHHYVLQRQQGRAALADPDDACAACAAGRLRCRCVPGTNRYGYGQALRDCEDPSRRGGRGDPRRARGRAGGDLSGSEPRGSWASCSCAIRKPSNGSSPRRQNRRRRADPAHFILGVTSSSR